MQFSLSAGPALCTAALIFLFSSCSRQVPVQAGKESGPIPIRVSSVNSRDIQRTIDSVGTLYPYDEAIISAEIDGRVVKVNIDLGDAVVQGQIMVQISDEEQRYLVQQTEAQLRQALERLGLSNENDKVKDIRETPEVRRVRADLVESEQNYKRVRSLVDQGIGSRSDLDQATARFQSFQANYDATLNQTRNLIQEVERNKAILNLQRKKLRDTEVRAPFNSFVKERQVTVGQFVRTNSPLLTLVKTDPIRLRIEVPERMAPFVRSGMVVEVTMEAFAQKVFQGKIWRIAPTVDQSKRTFVVEALIANPGGQLKAGSYARAKVPTDKVEHIRLVPTRALYYVLGANKVYVVKEGLVEAREVKLGDRFDKEVEILEGVELGEQVALSQLNRLDTGSKVRVLTGEQAEQARPPAE